MPFRWPGFWRHEHEITVAHYEREVGVYDRSLGDLRRQVEIQRTLLDLRGADFERTLVVLREENATLRRMLETSNARADQLANDLARSVIVSPGFTSPGPAGTPVSELPPRRTSTDPVRGVGNMLDPVPFTDPMGEFTDARAASLMAADEDDVSSAA